MATQYRFFINPFLSVTRNSYKKALTLGVDHKAKLVARQADPAVAALLLTFNPALDAYLTVDSNLNALLGGYKAKTQSLEELFELLAEEKLPYWEGQVFYHYPSGSAAATDIFPNKRGPFNDGTYEQRIQAIRTLGDKCTITPNLGPVGANILAFHTQIESARLMQQSEGEGAVAAQRTLRETARVALCTEMYGNMGILMHKHRENPEAVGDYFDMELLRSGNEEDLPNIIKTGNVAANAQLYINLEGANISAVTNITFQNTINTVGSILTAQFGSAPDAAFDSGRASVAFESLASEPQANKASEAGYDAAGGYTYLILYANNVQAGFRIEIEQ